MLPSTASARSTWDFLAEQTGLHGGCVLAGTLPTRAPARQQLPATRPPWAITCKSRPVMCGLAPPVRTLAPQFFRLAEPVCIFPVKTRKMAFQRRGNPAEIAGLGGKKRPRRTNRNACPQPVILERAVGMAATERRERKESDLWCHPRGVWPHPPGEFLADRVHV